MGRSTSLLGLAGRTRQLSGAPWSRLSGRSQKRSDLGGPWKRTALSATDHGAAQRHAEAARRADHKGIESWSRRPIQSDAAQPGVWPEMFDLLYYLRWQTSVPLKLNEFAILIIGRQWRSQVEWFAHVPLAIKAGLSQVIIAELKANRRPSNMPADEAVVYDFVTELTTAHVV